MVAFIDHHRTTYGVAPICRIVPIAPSTYFRRKAEQLDFTKRSARVIRDEVLQAIIARIFRGHDQVYGAHKVWKQMGREGLHEARCRVRRVMRDSGSAVSSAGAPGRPRPSRIRPPTGRPIWSTAASPPRGPISCGVRLHVCRHVERLRATAAANICPCATPSASPMPPSSRPSAVAAIASIMPWPNRSSGFSKRRSFVG